MSAILDQDNPPDMIGKPYAAVSAGYAALSAGESCSSLHYIEFAGFVFAPGILRSGEDPTSIKLPDEKERSISEHCDRMGISSTVLRGYMRRRKANADSRRPAPRPRMTRML